MPPAGSDVGPADPSTSPEPTAWIAQERAGVSGSPVLFIAVLAPLTVTVIITALILGADAGDPIASETLALEDGAYGVLFGSENLTAARIASSLVAGIAIVGCAIAARRLLHSDAAGIAASLLLVLDPAFLLRAHLAGPAMIIIAAGLAALAFASFSHAATRWGVPVALAVAGIFDPWMVAWGLPIGAMLLLRGHIYTTGKHLGAAAIQAIGIPGLVTAVAHGFLAVADKGHGTACLVVARGDALFLGRILDLGNTTPLFHAPVLWFVGLATLAGLGTNALVYVGARYRLNRLPGRFQVRLTGPLPRVHGRAGWLVLLFVLAPSALLWQPILVIAVMLGVMALGRDAPAFGVGTGAALVIVAAIQLIRSWRFVDGTATAADVEGLFDLLPWAKTQTC